MHPLPPRVGSDDSSTEKAVPKKRPRKNKNVEPDADHAPITEPTDEEPDGDGEEDGAGMTGPTKKPACKTRPKAKGKGKAKAKGGQQKRKHGDGEWESDDGEYQDRMR